MGNFRFGTPSVQGFSLFIYNNPFRKRYGRTTTFTFKSVFFKLKIKLVFKLLKVKLPKPNTGVILTVLPLNLRRLKTNLIT